MQPQASINPLPQKKPGKFFPSGLKKVNPQPITYDLIMLIMILTTFILPLYLAFPFVINTLKDFISEASKALIWLIGIILCGVVVLGLILGGEKLFGSSSNKKVETKVEVEVVAEDNKKEEVGASKIGEDPKIKKVWKDKLLSESTSTSTLTPKTRNTRGSKLSTPELIELNEINDSPSSRLRKRNV